jgi:hypothetical protein
MEVSINLLKQFFGILIPLCLPFLSTAQILGSWSWEQGSVTQKVFSPHSLCNKPWDARISTNIAREGQKSIRFESHWYDTTCGYSKRSELSLPKGWHNNEKIMWYAFSIFYPEDFGSDKRPELHWQIHHNQYSGSPLTELRVVENNWYFVQSFDSLQVGKQFQRRSLLGPIITNRWVDFVFYVNFDITEKGLIKIWQDGKQIFEIAGANANMDNGKLEDSSYMKFGIYKWQWSKATEPVYPDTRVVYFDRVMVGGEHCTLSDFLYKPAASSKKKKKKRVKEPNT